MIFCWIGIKSTGWERWILPARRMRAVMVLQLVITDAGDPAAVRIRWGMGPDGHDVVQIDVAGCGCGCVDVARGWRVKRRMLNVLIEIGIGIRIFQNGRLAFNRLCWGRVVE